MTSNYLEQLASEWYEYRGFFVRRNVPVGQGGKGGHEAELTIVAIHPGDNRVVHIEPSMDAHSWEVREKRFTKKFKAGREHLADVTGGLCAANEIEQIALIALGSRVNHPTLGGGIVLTIAGFMAEILEELKLRSSDELSVPQQYPILRTLEFVAENRRAVITALMEQDPRQISF
ncbi:MAG: hypothetical protein ACR2QU_05205 [Gammaproteobacteria bacterium]